jgi:hypothetical protein
VVVIQDESGGHDIEIDLDEVLDMEDDAVRKQFLRVSRNIHYIILCIWKHSAKTTGWFDPTVQRSPGKVFFRGYKDNLRGQGLMSSS